MKPLLRYSISGLLGLLITATLFLGMLSLLKGKKNKVTTDDANINFSFVKDFKEPEVKPKSKKELPKQEQVTQAPTTQPLEMEQPIEAPEVNLPNTGVTGNRLNIIKTAGLIGSGYDSGQLSKGDPGTIKNAIPPMYPHKELQRKIEGWVQLLIEVNEYGSVISAEVLQAKPARAFNNAAIKAVRKWKFHPQIVDGKPVPFQVTQTIEFKLEQ